MNIEEIKNILTSQNIQASIIDHVLMPTIVVQKEALVPTMKLLFEHDKLYFDYLSCITGLDLGTQAATMEVVYNLYSIYFNHHAAIKVVLERNTDASALPQIPSISHIWKSALWHEREVFDLFGIHFSDHPDLRRILNPADWDGYPLRKDYCPAEKYHEVKIKY